MEFYNEKITQINNPVDKKISDSLYWKRRAVQSLDNNEKILWFWMSIENLISTDLIFDKVSKFLAFEQLKEFASKHYGKLCNITEIGKERHFNKKIELSQELKKKLNLEHKSVNPEKFVDNIENIKKSLDEDELFSEQLDSLKDVFHNKKKCLDKLETFENLITTKLRYVYILRNKIVHSASNENNLLNDYYIDFISKASRDILWEFIKKRQINDLQTVDDILNEIMYDYDLLKDRVKKEGPQILLNIKN